MPSWSGVFALDGILGQDVNVRNLTVSYCAGCLVAIGWWLIIDVAVVYPDQRAFPHAYHTIGLFSTIALLLIVAPQAREDGGLFCSPGSSRLIVFSGCVIGFTCVICAVWIMFQDYVAYNGHSSAWPGVALFLQNLLIFTGALTCKLGRVDSDYIAL